MAKLTCTTVNKTFKLYQLLKSDAGPKFCITHSQRGRGLESSLFLVAEETRDGTLSRLIVGPPSATLAQH